ncbi:hypothetical protein [Aquabacterium sp.]|uniref:hypothetical protein n=1 Tax=Aquabacterium sp. TaxID=1872578 RepID=UPI0025BAF7B4|nr:hypothetical protein [Aquabacterium sp.]
MSGEVVPFTPAPQSKTATVALLDAATQVCGLIDAGQTLEFSLPQDLGERKRLAADMHQDIARREAVHGFLLLTIKAESPHGEWQAWLKGVRIGNRAAQQRMQVARLLLELRPDKYATVAHLPFRAQIALAGLSRDSVEAALEDGSLADMAGAPVEHIEAWAKERRQHEKTRDLLETVGAACATAEQQHAELLAHDRSGPIAYLRRVCADEVEAVQVASMGLLGQVAEALQQVPHVDDGRLVADALVPVRWAIHAARQQLAALQAEIEARYSGLFDPDFAPIPPALTAAEIEAAQRFRAWAIQEQDRRRQLRNIDAHARDNRPARRGRKGKRK